MRYRQVKKHWKYLVEVDEVLRTGILPPETIDIEFIRFDLDGTMTIRKGYAWNGPSGTPFHTRNFMTPSLFHDGGYNLMRENKLPRTFQGLFDALLERMVKERKMSDNRRWRVRLALAIFGRFSTKPDPDYDGNPVLEAP